MNISRLFRQFILGVFVIALLFVAGGVGFALYNDRTEPKEKAVAPQVTAKEEIPVRHTQPSTNAPESAAVQAINSPVVPGQETSIIIQTLPSSTCTIQIGYAGAPSGDKTFTEHNADIYGIVSWRWVVAAAAPVGVWPVTVTCVYHGRSAVVVDKLQIVKSM